MLYASLQIMFLQKLSCEVFVGSVEAGYSNN